MGEASEAFVARRNLVFRSDQVPLHGFVFRHQGLGFQNKPRFRVPQVKRRESIEVETTTMNYI